LPSYECPDIATDQSANVATHGWTDQLPLAMGSQFSFLHKKEFHSIVLQLSNYCLRVVVVVVIFVAAVLSFHPHPCPSCLVLPVSSFSKMEIAELNS
jgi:hypothetical protein